LKIVAAMLENRNGKSKIEMERRKWGVHGASLVHWVGHQMWEWLCGAVGTLDVRWFIKKSLYFLWNTGWNVVGADRLFSFVSKGVAAADVG